ncbi:6-phosphogluconolactonase [bacterium BMS3Abin07]|nr:6-phosphogluconolactonase [bacterium BMS3Abin07]GBE31942.1 6-phosphogluconolactonase [bacterium BMS3Bbin05]
MPGNEIEIFDSPDALYHFAAEYITGLISEKLKLLKTVTLALSGGSTPEKVYEKISALSRRLNFKWKHVHLFWGDERSVSPDNELSNFGMAHKSLISGISIPGENIHRIMGELSPEEGAAIYEKDMQNFFGSNGPPIFDLILLGLGDDAHTASLLPFSEALKEDRRWAVPVYTDKGPDRITLTLPVINNAGDIIFIVTGRKKTGAVMEVLSGDNQPCKYPAQGVKLVEGKILWLMDRPAASGLKGKIRPRRQDTK